MTPALIQLEGTAEEMAEELTRWRGRRVRVSIMPEVPEPAPAPDTRTIEEKIAEIMADVPDEEWAKLPPDLSDNLDHYLYGWPKKP